MKKSVAIIGGGPAGLMVAEVLSKRNLQVDVYDAKPSLGRKFLMAGKSGLNITHSENFEQFVSRYGNQKEEIQKWLLNFTSDDLRNWVHELGFETFVGTSGRVFPKGMKASPLLRAWLKRLSEAGVNFRVRHKVVEIKRPAGLISENESSNPTCGTVVFETEGGIKEVQPDAIILALGGGSWRKLGSTGEWVEMLNQLGVKVEALKPANCGFDVAWSQHFLEKYHGHPIKSVTLSFESFHQQGEFIITKEGVEGSLIYSASAMMRDEIEKNGKAVMYLDLAPDITKEKLIEKLSKPRGSRSLSSYVEKTIGIKGVKMGLLYEVLSKEDFMNIEKLATFIKQLPIELIATRPIDEAISTAGGVSFESLDENLMLKNVSGVFCAGEMLDWEAPTGGYLLSACFASGVVAGNGVINFLKNL
ncbi:MAG: TIGR03862 family flavoprotein [Anaerolineales bacterium]|nr:TIGR03862 family flavoprotein [Anaerolineales bacterium]